MIRYFFHKIEDVYNANAEELERGAKDLCKAGDLDVVFDGRSLSSDERKVKDYEELALKYHQLLHEADRLRQEGKIRQKRFNFAFWTLILVSLLGLFTLLPLSFAIDALALWLLIKQ